MILRVGKERSDIVFRKDALRELSSRSGGLVLTDENVYALYRQKFDAFCQLPLFVMETGEENKSADTLLKLLGRMAEEKLMRNSCLYSVGGGTVSDLGGLAASLYMRGIGLVCFPTTLLAQVDASIGGKTAVNFAGVKNLIGSFKFPSRVYLDPLFLKSLPEREIRCGLGEIIKHGALCSPLFEKLWDHRTDLLDRNFLGKIVRENVCFKLHVVRSDPYDRGSRVCLNLGHTTAHAVELFPESALSHGECVAVGLYYESLLAQNHFDCDREFLDRLRTLCLAVIREFPQLDLDHMRSVLLDKKNREGRIVLTVPVGQEQYKKLELSYADYIDELKRAEEC